jgi:hypothetical protein
MGVNDRIVRLTFASIALAVLGWTAFVMSRPNSDMLSYFADDAFYYLVPAYSFAHGEGWSFDHITRTSGFHVLYGYLAAIASLFFGYSRAFPTAMAFLTAGMLLFGLWVVLNRASRLYGAGIAAVAMALTLAVPRAFLQLTTGLEWSLAVMATALVIESLQSRPPRHVSMWAIAAASFVAALTRVDLSIFVAVYAVIVATSRWLDGEITLKDGVVLCGCAALGAAAAIAVTAVNSWAITGQWISNSLGIKAFWSRTNAFQPAISWDMLISCTGPGAILTFVRAVFDLRSRLVMAVFAAAAVLICSSEWRKGSDRRALALGSAAAILAYTVAYARGVNVMADHYSAPIVIPMLILSCGLLAAAGRYWPALAGSLAVGIAVVSMNSPWRGNPAHLVIARHADKLFAKVPQRSRIAGWNTGIAGWRTGGHVMNLDGLANASVVEAIQTGTVACFVVQQRIDYLMDFGYVFPGEIDTLFSDDEDARRRLHLERLGYDSAAMYRCVSVEATAMDDSMPNTRYRLFKVDSNCLAALCRNHR